MKMTNAFFSTSPLANTAPLAKTTWIVPSALIKSAHLIERIGLAAIGSSCGLYVAAGLMRRGNELSGSGWIVLLMMLYGAFSFYAGIDLPGRPAQRSTPRRPEERNPGADAAQIFSAAGTFLVAIAAFLSVSIIVLDETVHGGLIALAGTCWVVGSSFQIAAGTVARNYGTAEDVSG
jgi:hypothetical protein